MGKLDELRKKVEDRKGKKKGAGIKPEAVPEAIDAEQVEKIVSRMKKKYADQGIEFEEVGGRLRELRGIIAEGAAAKVEVQKVEDLTEFKSPLIRQLGKFYLIFQAPLKPLTVLLRKFPPTREIAYYLYSANMRFSVQQYLAICTAVAVIAFFGGLLFGLVIAIAANLPLIIIPIIAIVAFFFALLICLIYPSNMAKKRGDAISVELPFALRHMSTELKAGIGLYKTLQAIATSDYGVLSEEFARTITEIEEGTDTKDALRHFALRTQSKALRNALLHVVRALKTGGNLSEVMNVIAEDVAFELRMKMRDFGEKMNFFGVIFIMLVIVMPVFISIIGAVTNAPIPTGLPSLDARIMLIFYLVIMPFILIILLYYLKIAQPKV